MKEAERKAKGMRIMNDAKRATKVSICNGADRDGPNSYTAPGSSGQRLRARRWASRAAWAEASAGRSGGGLGAGTGGRRLGGGD